MKNKKAWTKILEVFVAIALLAGIILIILNSQNSQDSRKSEEIYKQQAFALKIIQLNDDLRKEVMNANSQTNSLPINSDAENFPLNVNNSINNALPNYLICKSVICKFESKCNLDNPPEKKDIYVKSVLITTDGTKYETRELKLFCWEE